MAGEVAGQWVIVFDDYTISMRLGSRKLTVAHSACDFRETVSYADLRREPLLCPNCGKTLAAHAELVELLEDELKRSWELRHRHTRMQYRRDLYGVRAQLLEELRDE